MNLAVTAPAQSLNTSGRGSVAPVSAISSASTTREANASDVDVTLSEAAKNRLLNEQQGAASNQAQPAANTAINSNGAAQNASFDPEQQQLIRQLAQRDSEVRNHERIHATVGGRYTSAPSYTYERGPDGRLYAVSGEVQIDTTPIPNNPQATLEKATMVQRAALAVPDPSPADRNAAAQARVMAAEARAEIARVARSDSVESENATPVVRETTQVEKTETDAERIDDTEDQPNQFELNSARMAAISQQLAELNRKLFDAGVMEQLYPAGSLVDLTV
ncbi:putative metalloprotease CJM1_0395 family protein [Neptuniibacter sp. CAU 1671]|uniref:putative metalloprotease CJM1_0395 family protein n=1 Tax=Neptuniibacter sp. CAU 1671 TaxID=3032593 RepID=UPI0023DAA7DF|nr:putative metalloprotease CJM1_0395 family protein [Neptuniibacter sp. CAU 1671]MDF2181473.1 putative metalloprotease CJM1_0395 family protein [Neptuniibacter sp. CAU 1671]